MKRLLFVCLSMSFILSSCSLDYRLERREDRLYGRWAFDEAFYRNNGAIFRDNIFDEFGGDIVEFFPDYSAAYEDASRGGDFFWGEWEIFAERDNGDDDVDFFLDMYFFDDRGFESFSYIGEVRNLTYNRMRIRAYDRDGVYTFRLRKID